MDLGDLHRVQDMYTRDRSTPREDRFYDGTEDLTGSAGSQIDGLTTIVFRRKLEGALLQRCYTIFLILHNANIYMWKNMPGKKAERHLTKTLQRFNQLLQVARFLIVITYRLWCSFQLTIQATMPSSMVRWQSYGRWARASICTSTLQTLVWKTAQPLTTGSHPLYPLLKFQVIVHEVVLYVCNGIILY